MSQSYDPDTIQRIRSSRQVLAGDQVTPLNDPWARPTGPGSTGSPNGSTASSLASGPAWATSCSPAPSGRRRRRATPTR